MTTPRRSTRAVVAGFVGALLLAGIWVAASALRGSTGEGMPAGADVITVQRVVDGDTLVTADGTRVRLIGIDAPEAHPEPECGADAATARLRELAPEGARLRAVADREDLDRYDRELRYLWTADGTFVNEALVAEGHAETIRVAPNTRYAERFADAEAAARAQGAGRWGTC